MLRALLIGGIGGGLLAFAFGAFSWMASPWKDHDIRKFGDEAAVGSAVQANVTGPGIYLLPHWAGENPPSPEEMKAKMEQGPLIFASVQLRGDAEMWRPYAGGLLIQVVTAMLLTWMVLQASIASYAGRLVFIGVFALAAGVVGVLPAWNWWGFPDRYTLILIGELLGGWLLAGLLIAWAAKPSAAR